MLASCGLEKPRQLYDPGQALIYCTGKCNTPGCHVQGPSTVCLPLVQKATRKASSQSAEAVEMQILRRFKYDPALLLSCVVAARAGSSDLEVFIKGNAVSISQHCRPSNQPADWGQARLCSCCCSMLCKSHSMMPTAIACYLQPVAWDQTKTTT